MSRPAGLLDASASAVVVVDMQPAFLAPIVEAGRVLASCEFLCRCARLLGVPVFATEQYPARMGGTDPSLSPYLSRPPFGKMRFGAHDGTDIIVELSARGCRQVVLAGIETPICVLQSAFEFLEGSYEVFVAADAAGARSLEDHDLALRRMASAGVPAVPCESAVYEWMETAEHPAFREVLALVKGRA